MSDRNEYPDSHRLSYGALVAILGRKHDRVVNSLGNGIEWSQEKACVGLDASRDPPWVWGTCPGVNKQLTTCGELRAFCVLAGWTNQERGASRGE